MNLPAFTQALEKKPDSASGDSALHQTERKEPHRRRATDHEIILIVDDQPENLSVLGELLQEAGYRVKVANNGPVALQLARQLPRPGLILLDVVMPQMSGHEVLRQLREEETTRDIPVIFLTAQDSDEDEERAFDAGIADYIIKPLKPAVVLARVRSQLLVRRARHLLQNQNNALEAEVTRRMRENELIQSVSIRALAHLAETRDNETGNHIMRTQGYIRLLAQRLATHRRFASIMTLEYIDLLARSAPLHDIGKVGIPDRILLKPGKLTPEEWEIMKTHTLLGCNAIAHAEHDMQTSAGFLAQAKEISRWHHERWDGKGYPDGLVGDNIPVSARLMAIADVFDAMISRRVYKEPIPMNTVREMIEAQRGLHFDPDITDAFINGFHEFEAIALYFGLEN